MGHLPHTQRETSDENELPLPFVWLLLLLLSAEQAGSSLGSTEKENEATLWAKMVASGGDTEKAFDAAAAQFAAAAAAWPRHWTRMGSFPSLQRVTVRSTGGP